MSSDFLPTEGDHVLTLDLETASADAMFTMIVDAGSDRERPVEGPFIRLCGYAVNDGPVQVTTDVDELLDQIDRADVIQGTNILGFDGLALAFHHGMDWDSFARKAFDTDPLSRYDFPPRSREHGSADQYDLDHVAQRLGLNGKITGDSGLAALHRRYKGYDRIPVDDPDFIKYLIRDVEASREVAKVLRRAVNDYTRREHRLLAYTGRMTLNGFPVNRPLLESRIKEGQKRKLTALKELNERYGIPLGRTVLRGRGKAKSEVFEPFKSPLATKEGKAALVDAFASLGARHYPKTPKTGDIAAGREGMEKMIAHYVAKKGLKPVQRLCDLVITVTTVRTIYQTALNNLAPDGRVHPRCSMRQASGRLSVTPGMTVFGKHAGRHVEREIFVADPGHVLITCDLSQVDMRAVAAHSQDPAYMALFEPGKDAHQEVADMLGLTRQDAKARSHGYNYGLGAKRMIREGADPKVVWAFVNGMERRFPKMCSWREEVRAIGASGEYLDNGFGRPMRCDPRFSYTQAPALMGQGTARDITMECLVRLLADHPEYAHYVVNQVHDEWIFNVPADLSEVVKGHIVEAFTWTWRNTPILCEATGPGPDWGTLSAK
jgi:DNA polymerase-1